jgi:hypothetical protein
MRDVEGVRLRQSRIEVDQHNLARHASQAEGVGRRTANHARSDDTDFHLPTSSSKNGHIWLSRPGAQNPSPIAPPR